MENATTPEPPPLSPNQMHYRGRGEGIEGGFFPLAWAGGGIKRARLWDTTARDKDGAGVCACDALMVDMMLGGLSL